MLFNMGAISAHRAPRIKLLIALSLTFATVTCIPCVGYGEQFGQFNPDTEVNDLPYLIKNKVIGDVYQQNGVFEEPQAYIAFIYSNFTKTIVGGRTSVFVFEPYLRFGYWPINDSRQPSAALQMED